MSDARVWTKPTILFGIVRAEPLAKPKRYESLSLEAETELIRSYHEHGDLDALDRLVGAHRPMVVIMAKNMWRGTTRLRTLVEYGMLGLRIAAEPPRPSLTKKGEMVGFDPAKGNRFGTYARRYAKKEMMAAVFGGYTPPARSPELEQKAAVAIEGWWRLPDDEKLSDHELPLGTREGYEAIFRFLASRRGLPPKCARGIDLWSLGEPTSRKLEPRKYPAQPVTARELANRDLYYLGCYLTLETYKNVADDGMWSWPDDNDELWEPASGGFGCKLYRLAKKVLEQRRKLGCKREGKIVPYRFNNGLGLFDRRGHRLPDYGALGGKVTVIRKRQFTPFLCLRPLASIYSMRRMNVQWIPHSSDKRRRHNPITETTHGKRYGRKKAIVLKLPPVILDALDEVARQKEHYSVRTKSEHASAVLGHPGASQSLSMT